MKTKAETLKAETLKLASDEAASQIYRLGLSMGKLMQAPRNQRTIRKIRKNLAAARELGAQIDDSAFL